MTDQEIIYKAISEVVNTDKPSEFAAHNSTCYTIAKYVCDELRKQLNSLPAEQPSNDLEKEIDRVIKEVVTPETLQDYIMGFKAGAQWQKEQMMKSAIDAKIVNDESSGCVVDCEQGCLVLEPHRYPIGQKLKILILEGEQCSTE